MAGAMTAVGRLGGLEKLAPAEDGRFLALAASGLPHRPTRADEPVAAVGECCRRVWNTGVAPASAPLPPLCDACESWACRYKLPEMRWLVVILVAKRTFIVVVKET